MRFKKGSKVEVLSKKEVPSGVWHCAKIISGNGHTYNVTYDGSLCMTSDSVIERVSRKIIRPCPPIVESMESWAVGDVVEVFDLHSWRIAMVLKVGGEYYLVRLLGSCEEFRIHKSNIRVRQSWQDDKWVVIGKGSGSAEALKSNKPSGLNCHQMTYELPRFDTRIKMQAGSVPLAAQDNSSFQEAHSASSRTFKRASPYCSSHIEAYSRKMRVVEKEGEHQRVISESPYPLQKKVDAVAYPRENLGEKYMHASFNNQTTGYFDMERGNQNGAFASFHERSSEPIDYDSDACSVGSCSVVSNSPNQLSGNILAGPTQDADTLYSDADSFSDSEDEKEKCPLPLKEDVAARIHRLELHAYRSTLEAMYASGPLSWEQEALLTNLRISLHISNDEHLMEIRNLISAGTSLHLS